MCNCYEMRRLGVRCEGDGALMGEKTKFVGTFGAWLKRQLYSQNAIGDLARDWFTDPCRPLGPVTPEKMKAHMLECHEPIDDALKTVDEAAAKWGKL